MHQDDCFYTLLPGRDVVSSVSGALVVFSVSADSSVEGPASENMHCILDLVTKSLHIYIKFDQRKEFIVIIALRHWYLGVMLFQLFPVIQLCSGFLLTLLLRSLLLRICIASRTYKIS